MTPLNSSRQINMHKVRSEIMRIHLCKSLSTYQSFSLRICTLSWKKVDRAMVSNYFSHGVRLALGTDNSGGLIINGQVTNRGCGNGPGSAMVVHIKGDWKQIMYTQVFQGDTSCWGIFGNE